MNNGDIIVGDKLGSQGSHDPPPAAAPVDIQKLTAADGAYAARTDQPKTNWPNRCGAMSEQRGDTSAQSTPQKFVRLVGYRDPNTKPIRR
ncbi:hypothetical protein [Bradyrhizobium sp.]|uniref:hypothetical protein n=1 Tax=Bradyrhizobium sp. TaxID=376 RepID=UPI003C3A0F05